MKAIYCITSGCRYWVAMSRSPWRVGDARSLMRAIFVELPLLKVQWSVSSQDDEWRVMAATVIGRQNLIGCSQHCTVKSSLLETIPA